MSLGDYASVERFQCETITANKGDRFMLFNPNPQTFISFGTKEEGEKAYIRTDGTCSFVNQSALNFSGLGDVPNGYSEQKGKVVLVKDDETGLGFSDTLSLTSLSSNTIKTSEITTDTLKTGDLDIQQAHIKALYSQIQTTQILSSDYSQLGKASVNALQNAGDESIQGKLSVVGSSVLSDVQVDSLSVKNKVSFAEADISVLNCDTLCTTLGGLFNTISVKDAVQVSGSSSLQDITTKSITNEALLATNDIQSSKGTINTLTSLSLSTKNISLSGDVLGTPENPILISSDGFTLNTTSNKLVVYGVINNASPTLQFTLSTSISKLLVSKEIRLSFQVYDNGGMIVPWVSQTLISALSDDKSAQIGINFTKSLPTIAKFILVITLYDL